MDGAGAGPQGAEHDRLGELVDAVPTDVGMSGVIRVDVEGHLAVARAYGLAHRGLGVANAVDTRLGIASGSKWCWRCSPSRLRGCRSTTSSTSACAGPRE